MSNAGDGQRSDTEAGSTSGQNWLFEASKFFVPFSRPQNFVGREAIIKKLVASTLERVEDDCRHTVLYGVGGVGKTNIALQTAYCLRDKSYDCSVFWLKAPDAATFARSYENLHKYLVPYRSEHDWGAQHEVATKRLFERVMGFTLAGRWFMVVDDADGVDNLDFFFTSISCLPLTGKGHIVLTTRDADIASSHWAHENIQVPPMNRQEALELFRKCSNLEPTDVPESARQLVDVLGRIPLAIAQASNYISRKQLPITEYIELLEEGNDKLPFVSLKNTIRATIEHLESVLPQAINYLTFMCFLKPDEPITVTLLYEVTGVDKISAVMALKDYSLVMVDEDRGLLTIHRLVSHTVRDYLKSGVEWKDYCSRVLEGLNEALKLMDEAKREVWRGCLPHAVSALSYMKDEELAGKPEALILLIKVGSCEAMLDRLVEAEKFYWKAWELVNPDCERLALHILQPLGDILGSQGKLAEQEEVLWLLRNKAEKAISSDDSTIAASHTRLIVCLHRQGKYRESGETFWAMLKLLDDHSTQRQLGPPADLIGLTVKQQALMIKCQGEQKAAKALTQCLWRDLWCSEHWDGVSILLSPLKEAYTLGPTSRLLNEVKKMLARDDEDSDDSSEGASSIFSVRSIATGSTSLGSEPVVTSKLLIQEFIGLLRRDGYLMSLLSVAVSREDIGLQRIRSNFRKLLKRFAFYLGTGSTPDLVRKKQVAGFVGSSSTQIAQALFAGWSLDEMSEFSQHLRGQSNTLKGKEKVEEFLGGGVGEPNRTDDDSMVGGFHDEGSDSDTSSEPGAEHDQLDPLFTNIQQMEQFIRESDAYRALQLQLYNFVFPSWCSELDGLAERWLTSDHKYYASAVQYGISEVISGLQLIEPSAVMIDNAEKEGPLRRMLGSWQYKVEKHTGSLWSWWPISHYPRALVEGEVLLRWKCTCGDNRWAITSSAFAKRISSIVQKLQERSPTPIQPPPASSKSTPGTGETGAGRGTGDQRQVATDFSRGGPSYASSGSMLGDGPTGTQSSFSGFDAQSGNVLLLVRQWPILEMVPDYKLAHIPVTQVDDAAFFRIIREEYFRLRGFIRSWFSVWRYSHCDFYECEKWEDSLFSPTTKDRFPDKDNLDYRYSPKPMPNSRIPPVNCHEFAKRFYACSQSGCLLHWYHKCRRPGHEQYNLLDVFPKKMTKLEEQGRERKWFWGIYAREHVSVGAMMMYNLICVIPLLMFFMGWTIPLGKDTDLQNPHVPAALTISLLSLFWTTYQATWSRDSPSGGALIH